MSDIHKIYKLYELKFVNRRGVINDRHETSAEHTYSCLVLAKYFLPLIDQKIDELKVMNMILFHDIIEIESGDTFNLIHDKSTLQEQTEKELKALDVLKSKIPKNLENSFTELFHEFESMKTIESRFCKAIDKLDPVIHNLYGKKAWQNNKFNEEILRQNKQKYFEEFPEILRVFNEFINYAKENNYFKKF